MSKNTRTRILLTAVAALLLVVMAVGGTMAWLQDVTDEVQNTFTTTNVDIKLEETTGEDYTVVPGEDIEKDPTVTVIKGSEKSWVFVKVDVTEGFETYLPLTFDSNWTQLSKTTADGVTTYVLFKLVEKDAENDTVISVLANDTIIVSENLTNANMDALEALDAKLTFTAYAIQYAGNESGASAAWTKVQGLVYGTDDYTTISTDGEGTNVTAPATGD